MHHFIRALCFGSLMLIASGELFGRSPNPSINVSPEPPATAVGVEDAFPGLTFVKPVAFRSPPDDNERLFVGELGGKIHVIPDTSEAVPTSVEVLDIVDVVTTPPRVPAESITAGPANECGLLGFDFHPDYDDNGWVYVFYSVTKASDSGVWYQRLSRFTVPEVQRGNPAPVIDPASELILLEQRDRASDHNGGDVHFGPDGYLYVSLGDEANPRDQYNNSQLIDMNFFGGIIRIDVDKRPGNLEPNTHPNPTAASQGFSSVDGIPRDEVPPGSGVYRARYSVPIDNPWVHTSDGGDWDGVHNGSSISAANLPYIRSEFWAIGLRSPWRFSIDDETEQLWVGDVGQSINEFNFYYFVRHGAEEINQIVRGGNYGWPYAEGTGVGVKRLPSGFESLPPYYEIKHTFESSGDYLGTSLIGGVVYRGDRFESLTGAYIFGDYVFGNIWALRDEGGGPEIERIAGLANLAAFGEDPNNGDVLISDYNNGKIKRLVTNTPSTTFPETLTATGLFTDVEALTPAAEVIPYDVNLPFWSDYAIKSRWFTIPDGVSRMDWSRDSHWTFPSGQIWVKHFELETVRGDSDSPRKRIETRLLVKNDDGAYGVSYRWNETGTEAVLVEDGGESFTVDIMVDGAPHAQQWSIPSRAQCMSCHGDRAGSALGFDTRQLNLNNPLPPSSGNQLEYLAANDYFNNNIEPAVTLPRHVNPDESEYTLESRVRSYIAVNCSHCHAGIDGSVPAAWDGRITKTLEETFLVNEPSTKVGAPFKLINPGQPAHSTVLQSIRDNAGFSSMPPLGRHEVDEVGAQLLEDWINSGLPSRQFYQDWRLATFGSSDSAEGEKDHDADGDGESNYSEYLAGTDALNAGSIPRLGLSVEGNALSLSYDIPANRSAVIETSCDLNNWVPWAVSGNDGIDHAGGPVELNGNTEDDCGFFRLRIDER